MEKQDKKNLLLSTYKEYGEGIKRNNKYRKENYKKIQEETKREILGLKEKIKEMQEQVKIKPTFDKPTWDGYTKRIKGDRDMWKEEYNFIENEDSKKIKWI